MTIDESFRNLKFVSMLIIAVFLLTGTGAAAYIDNYTVLDTFLDGQAKHVMYNHTLSSPRDNLLWTCPDNQIMITDEIEAQDDNIAPSPPCYISRPKLTHERQELWLNPLGQVVKMRYPDKYLEQDKAIIVKMPANDVEVVSDANWNSYYLDTDGVVVSYHAEQVVPSNKTLKSPVTYPVEYSAEKAMSDLKLTKQEFLNVSNYGKIAAEAYNHSAEYQAIRIQELELELEQSNTLIEQLKGRLQSVENYLNATLGFVSSLW